MNARPTPETDAMIETDAHRIEEYSAPLTTYRRMCELAKTLECERDEAREAAEKAKAYKRVMKEDNAKLRRELADEQAIADRLASVMFGCTARDMNDAYDAWKEARK